MPYSLPLNQLEASTRRHIRGNGELVDMVFQRSIEATAAKESLREDFPGGSVIQEDFNYGVLKGGPYQGGQNFDTSEKQIEGAAHFNMKRTYVNITIDAFEARVLNTGPQAAYKLVTNRINAGYQAMGAFLAIGMHLNGINANYVANINGFDEALNDGSTASWSGNSYANYGGLSRTGDQGSKLVSVPVDIAGEIEYNALEDNYMEASYSPGEFEPNLILTTAKGFSYIKQKFQTQQRFPNTTDPTFGFNGMAFNNATVVWSRYVPGTAISGSNFDEAVEFVKTMSQGAVTAYPTVTGEVLYYLNWRKPFINWYLTNDEMFGLGTTGWKWDARNTMFVNQILMAHQMTVYPRYHKMLFGITG